MRPKPKKVRDLISNQVISPMRNFSTNPVEEVVEELVVEAADVGHDTQLVYFRVSHVVWCQQGWDTQILFCYLNYRSREGVKQIT